MITHARLDEIRDDVEDGKPINNLAVLELLDEVDRLRKRLSDADFAITRAHYSLRTFGLVESAIKRFTEYTSKYVVETLT